MLVQTAKGSSVQIDSVLVLSTGHLKQETDKALTANSDDMLPTALTWEHGYLVWADPDIDADAYPDLAACIALAKALECAWVRFDCDFKPIAELPTYDW